MFVSVIVGLAALAFCGAAHAEETDFHNLLDFHGTPADAKDRSFNIFFDQGSWHGYSLPPSLPASTGFTGPFVHSLGTGRWVGENVGRLELTDSKTGAAVSLVADERDSYAAPGYLRRTFRSEGLTVRETLFFADSWHAVVRIELTAAKPRTISLAATGHLLAAADTASTLDGDKVVQTFAGTNTVLITRLMISAHAGLEGSDYRLAANGALKLLPGASTAIALEQTLLYDVSKERPPVIDHAAVWAENRRRWNGYLTAVQSAHLAGIPDDVARRVSAKAVVTLLGNWRAARGDLHHDGVIPSYSNPDFNGFWAWDSWKHAAALAAIAPALARDQMRAMFDYQAENGMVPDCLFLEAKANNGRNSKPPLAGWAALRIYRATGDVAFLEEMYGKLTRYHRWWSTARDHARDGLSEYGSTDGSRKAAGWESGMDNAVRFDHISMLDNGAGNWSADQESVDLSAYLYGEKRDLASIAAILGKGDDERAWRTEADELRDRLRARMFDAARGYFFDAKLPDHTHEAVFGPEGWIPLMVGAATPEQAKQVAAVMLDPKKFATKMPFPTLAADDPRFEPVTGYWRGPVWLDQAYFAVVALRRYGYGREAEEMARRLVSNAEGVTGTSTFREVYDPVTGQGLESRNFSWSAAHYFLLLAPPGADR
jgi:putative isomerase